MDTILGNLTPRQKISALKVGLAVVASTNEGKIRTNDPDILTLAEGLYGESSDESRRPEVLIQRVREAIGMEETESSTLLKQFSIQEQNAYKILLGKVYHDDAVRMFSAAVLLKDAGFAPPQGALYEEPKAKPDLQVQSMVEITDVAAVRGDSTEWFNLFLADSEVEAQYQDPARVQANYDAWIDAELCPTEGMVGSIGKIVESPEGTLYYVVIENLMVIPMLGFGIDVIDYGTYLRYRGNNQFHAYDPDGTRCRALKAAPRVVKEKVERKIEPGTAKVNVVTHILRRFENGIKLYDSYTERLVLLEYSEKGRRLDLTVHGSMQTKHAELVSDDGSVLKYKDLNNPQWARYEVETGPYNETVRVSVFMGTTEYQYHV